MRALRAQIRKYRARDKRVQRIRKRDYYRRGSQRGRKRWDSRLAEKVGEEGVSIQGYPAKQVKIYAIGVVHIVKSQRVGSR